MFIWSRHTYANVSILVLMLIELELKVLKNWFIRSLTLLQRTPSPSPSLDLTWHDMTWESIGYWAIDWPWRRTRCHDRQQTGWVRPRCWRTAERPTAVRWLVASSQHTSTGDSSSSRSRHGASSATCRRLAAVCRHCVLTSDAAEAGAVPLVTSLNSDKN